MSGMKEVTFNQMGEMKFNVISHFGVVKQKRNRQFFIMDVIPPTKYGADCRTYAWYQVILKTEEDYKQAKAFIEKLFQIQCPELNKENCIQSVRLLNNKLKSKAKIVDWGACHVVHLPFSRQFAN